MRLRMALDCFARGSAKELGDWWLILVEVLLCSQDACCGEGFCNVDPVLDVFVCRLLPVGKRFGEEALVFFFE